MTRDFTLSKYGELCKAFLCLGYNTITVQEYLQGQAVEPFVILRHDVDRRPEIEWVGKIFYNKADEGDFN